MWLKAYFRNVGPYW